MKNLIASMTKEAEGSNKTISADQIEKVAKARIALQEGVVSLTFRKVNGTERTIEHATTKAEHVSGTCKNTGDRYKCVSPVYDLDEGSWKSFKWENLISFKVAE